MSFRLGTIICFISTVSAVGFCDAEVNIDTPHGIYNWSETEVGKNATNRCVYNTTEQFGLARRHCASARQWDDYFGDQCITRNTHRIQRINEVSITVVIQNMEYWNIHGFQFSVPINGKDMLR